MFMKWRNGITKDIDSTMFPNSSTKNSHSQVLRKNNYLQNDIASIMKLV